MLVQALSAIYATGCFTPMKKKILKVAIGCIWMIIGLLIVDYSIDGQYEAMASPARAISVKSQNSQALQSLQMRGLGQIIEMRKE